MLTDSPIQQMHSDRDRLQRLSEMLKALAQPTRLELLEILGNGDRCVCELAEAVGAERSNVSRHLAVLHRAGIVTMSRKGVQIIYALKMRCIFETLQCMAGRSTAISSSDEKAGRP